MAAIRNHQDCAHRWAAQRGPNDSGRSGPLYYRGPTIYSYGEHYPIATFVRPDVVLFSATGSSMTTDSKHKPAVRRALWGLPVQVFVAPAGLWRSLDATLEYLTTQCRAALDEARRATRHTGGALARAEQMQDSAREFAETFGLSPPAIYPPADIAALTERAAAQDAATEKRDADRRERWAHGKDIAAAKEISRRALNNWQAAAKRAAALIDADRWLRGESIPGFYLSEPTLLRVRDGRIETSRGASVDTASALKLWNLAKRIKAHGIPQGFAPGSFEVDGFALRRIDADGTITIGCHVLRMEHMRPIAESLGWEM